LEKMWGRQCDKGQNKCLPQIHSEKEKEKNLTKKEKRMIGLLKIPGETILIGKKVREMDGFVIFSRLATFSAQEDEQKRIALSFNPYIPFGLLKDGNKWFRETRIPSNLILSFSEVSENVKPFYEQWVTAIEANISGIQIATPQDIRNMEQRGLQYGKQAHPPKGIL